MRCSVLFGATLRLFVINISSSSPAINTAAYYQRCVTNLRRDGTVAVVHRRPCWQHLACCSFNSKQWIAQNRDFCLYPTCIDAPLWRKGSRRSIAIPFGSGVNKLEWRGYRMVKKFWWYVYLFWHNSRTWQTHTHTDTAWRHRPRLHSIARQEVRDINNAILKALECYTPSDFAKYSITRSIARPSRDVTADELLVTIGNSESQTLVFETEVHTQFKGDHSERYNERCIG